MPAELKKKKVSISDILPDVLKENLENIQLKKISIIKHTDPKCDIIIGDADLVKKSISNILDNSIIFSPENGSIEIKTYIRDKYNVFEIRDQGNGFSANMNEHIDEFFTLKDKYRDNSKGIGLPIVNMIMESHGGKLILENHPSGGAVVKLCFLIEASN